MNTVKCLVFLLFIVAANGVSRRSGECILDPLGSTRQLCRERLNLTREQVRKAANDLQSIRDYLVCFASSVGSLNEDGSVNKEMHLKNTELANPLVIAEPITNCCLDRVYKGRKPEPHEVARLLTDFVICWKNLLPNSIWNLVGILEPPVYPRLDECQEC